MVVDLTVGQPFLLIVTSSQEGLLTLGTHKVLKNTAHCPLNALSTQRLLCLTDTLSLTSLANMSAPKETLNA